MLAIALQLLRSGSSVPACSGTTIVFPVPIELLRGFAFHLSNAR
jgi:hypothetical protein